MAALGLLWGPLLALAPERKQDPGEKLDWEGQFREALDPEKARRLRAESGVADHGACTMCGEFCAYKVMDDAMEKQQAVKA